MAPDPIPDEVPLDESDLSVLRLLIPEQQERMLEFKQLQQRIQTVAGGIQTNGEMLSRIQYRLNDKYGLPTDDVAKYEVNLERGVLIRIPPPIVEVTHGN